MRRKVVAAAVLLLALSLFGLPVLPVYAGSVDWQVAGTNYIYDSNGTTKLVAGDYVQLWDVNNDVLLDEATIGDGLMSDGQFSKMGLNLSAGTYTINIRAYNKDKAHANDADACSGISTQQVIVVTGTSIGTVDFAGFSTTTCPGDPTAIDMAWLRVDTGTSTSWLTWVWLGLLLVSSAFSLTLYRRHTRTH